MFKLHSELQKDEDECKKHIEALLAMTGDREHKILFEYFYDWLSILDAKATSLLTSNAVITAVFAIVLTSRPPRSEWIVANVGMAAILASCLLLLSVVWVYWSTTNDLQDHKNHPLMLLQLRNSRTAQYGRAWRLSMVSVLSLVLLVAIGVVRSVCHGAP